MFVTWAQKHEHVIWVLRTERQDLKHQFPLGCALTQGVSV